MCPLWPSSFSELVSRATAAAWRRTPLTDLRPRPLFSAQGVIRLILVDGAALRQIARDQAEAIDRERLGAKQRVLLDVGLEPRLRGAPQARQRDMRRVATRLGLEADPHQRALHLLAQMQQRRVLLDTGPQHPIAELADAAQHEGERLGVDALHSRIDVPGNALGAFPDEPPRP